MLRRKIATVQALYLRGRFEQRRQWLLGLMCICGIELLAGNASECRERLVQTFDEFVDTESSLTNPNHGHTVVGMVANPSQGLQMVDWPADPGYQWTSEKVRVVDVLDRVRAEHPEDTIDSESAEMLVSLAEGVIQGARTRGRSRWAGVLGPVVKPGVASALLGISTTALDKRRDTGAVLGVQTENRRWVYPLAQFRANRHGGVEVLPGLRDVLTELLSSGDGLAAARWLATPNRRLDAATPWEVLSKQSRQPSVVDAARSQATAWAGS